MKKESNVKVRQGTKSQKGEGKGGEEERETGRQGREKLEEKKEAEKRKEKKSGRREKWRTARQKGVILLICLDPVKPQIALSLCFIAGAPD